MPITIVHMGPGMALKSVAGRYFSLSAFAVAQVAMDIEPIVRTFRGDLRLHGFTHTYIGALVIATAVFPLCLILCPLILWIWNWIAKRYRMGLLAGEETVKTGPVAVGALTGTFSHVAIDSIMHADMRPLAPFSSHNPLRNIVSIDALDLSCLALGLIGLGVYVWFRGRRGRH